MSNSTVSSGVSVSNSWSHPPYSEPIQQPVDSLTHINYSLQTAAGKKNSLLLHIIAPSVHNMIIIITIVRSCVI